ncbi:inorganic pyrophosphatase [Mycena sp. CBHHK59/15]|nr:inorganic pyrophosphatase [Mycena sp. CBHHK59/15]
MPPSTVTSLPAYTAHVTGAPNTAGHRITIAHNGHTLSPLNDISLFAAPSVSTDSRTADTTDTDTDSQSDVHNADSSPPDLHMVVEAPRWSSVQMAVGADALRPVLRRHARPAHVRSCFPHHGYLWNYGVLPQTRQPSGAPLRVCELGTRVAQAGDVRRVRVLGVLAPRDEGWTLLAVDVADALAPRLHDVGDVERECPGLLAATREWFKVYKLPEGKPLNTFALEGVARGRAFAAEVVDECHASWGRAQADPWSVRTPTESIEADLRAPVKADLLAAREVDLHISGGQMDPRVRASVSSSATKWWFIGSHVV